MKDLISAVAKAVAAAFAQSANQPETTSQTIPFVNGKPTEISDLGPIKEFESLRLTGYMPTPNDRPTIGWGHTKTAELGMTITEEEAEKLLREDLSWVKDVIARQVHVPLTQPQYDALCSLIFNIGEVNFKRSTVLRRLNERKYKGAASAFLMWNKQRDKKTGKLKVLRGLTRRRKHEKDLFMKGTKE